MDLLAQWLEPYRAYLDTAEFLAAIEERAGQASAVQEDAGRLFESLIAPIDAYGFSTKAFTNLFLDPTANRELATSPRGAVELFLPRVRNEGALGGRDVGVLAEALAKLGEFRKAEICTAVAYLLGERSMPVLGLLAGLAVREGRFAEAGALVAEAEGAHAERPEPRYYRGLLQLASGELAAAVASLAQLTADFPQYKPGWHLLVLASLRAGRAEAGVRHASDATAHHPLLAEAWEDLASAQAQAGRPEEALGSIRRALDLTRESIGLPVSLLARLQLRAAELEQATGRPEEALRRYRALLDAGRHDPAIFLGAAGCVRRLGKGEEAETVLRQGLALHPQHPEISTALGQLLFDVGSDQEAFNLLQTAAESEPRRTENLFLMAALALRNRSYATAIELASAVAKADRARVTEALVLIGDAYRFEGVEGAARAAYVEADLRSPGDPAIRRRMDELEEAARAKVSA